MKFIISVFFALLILLASPLVWAAKGSSGGSRSGFGLDAAFYGGSGPSGNSDGTIPSRVLNTSGIAVRPGWKFGWFVPQLFYEYEMIGQAAEPSSVSNQNIGGTASLLGVGFKFVLSSVFLSVGYDLSGDLKLAKKSTAGLESSYSKMQGYEATLCYMPEPSFGLYVLFIQRTFSENTLGSEKIDISNNKLSQNFIGVGIMTEMFR